MYVYIIMRTEHKIQITCTCWFADVVGMMLPKAFGMSQNLRTIYKM